MCAIAFKSAKHKLSNAFPKLLAIKSLAAVQGAIDEHEEQDADVVGLLVRPEFYETNEKAKQGLSLKRPERLFLVDELVVGK